jgi:hypothetical protein
MLLIRMPPILTLLILTLLILTLLILTPARGTLKSRRS